MENAGPGPFDVVLYWPRVSRSVPPREITLQADVTLCYAFYLALLIHKPITRSQLYTVFIALTPGTLGMIYFQQHLPSPWKKLRSLKISTL